MKNNKNQPNVNQSGNKDISNRKVYNISQIDGANFEIGIGNMSTGIIGSAGVVSGEYNENRDNDEVSFSVDREATSLVHWLAEQQNISPELALKKAVATAAYIYDVTECQGGRLLVQRKNQTIGEIVLK